MSVASAVRKVLLGDVGFRTRYPQVFVGDAGQAHQAPYVVLLENDLNPEETLDSVGDEELLEAGNAEGQSTLLLVHCLHNKEGRSWKLARAIDAVIGDYEGVVTLPVEDDDEAVVIRIDAMHLVGTGQETIFSEDGSQIHAYDFIHTYKILFAVVSDGI